MRIAIPLLALAIASAATSSSAQVAGEATFFPPYTIQSGGPQNETGADDFGGLLVGLFENTTGRTLEARNLNLRIAGEDATSIPGVTWVRFWPPEIPDGSTFSVEAKSMHGTLAEGNSALLVVREGETPLWARNTQFLRQPIRIAHVAVSRDRKGLELWLRNQEGPDALEVTGVWFNGEDLAVGEVLPWGTTIESGEALPGSIPWAGGVPHLAPIHLRVAFRGPSDSEDRIVQAAVRATDPSFILGTWSGSLYQSIGRLRRARGEMGHTNAVATFRRREVFQWGNAFGVRNMPVDIIKSDLDPEPILNAVDNTGVFAWNLFDEPDLGGASAGDLAARNLVYWETAPRHPTTVTLAANRAFQRYGAIVDYPMMDHYGQFAPLVYTTGLLSSTYSIRNTYEYSKALKRATEPRISWAWAQGLSPETSSWSNQPTPWGIEIQFWNHLAAGAKGLMWFKGVPSEFDDYPDQAAMIHSLLDQFSMVRDHAYFGDALENVQTTASNALGASVVGRDRILVIVTNASATYTRNLIGSDTVSISTVDTDATVALPHWIEPESVLAVTPAGLAEPGEAFSTAPGSITFMGLSLTQAAPTRVYLVGAADTTPPKAPRNLRVADWIDGETAVLVWDEASDDTGVQRYEVRGGDGSFIADTKRPYLELGGIPPEGRRVLVRAVDGAGNPGQWSPKLAKIHRWDFEADLHTHGWQRGNQTYIHEVRNGFFELEMSSSADFMDLLLPVPIEAQPGDVIRVRLRNGTNGNLTRLQWRRSTDSGFQVGRSVTAPIVPFSEEVVIDYAVGAHADWSGTIEEFRFRTATNGNTGTSFVALIELNPVPGNEAQAAWKLMGE